MTTNLNKNDDVDNQGDQKPTIPSLIIKNCVNATMPRLKKDLTNSLNFLIRLLIAMQVKAQNR